MVIPTEELLDNLSPSVLNKIIDDPVKAAKAVKLVYVSDEKPGISRKKEKGAFIYYKDGKKIKDAETLARIKSLVIPPAWENVWVCNNANGHLQATGLDMKNRKQYRYHPAWNALRNHTKFFRMQQFGTALPNIRLAVDKHLSLPGLPQEKILAAMVSLMEKTNIRIGNSIYEKLYGSFGLTTFKNKHVQINGNALKFTFKGKKGVPHDISLKSKKLANIVLKCKEIPGKELFQYIDENGEPRSIDSGMVNEYIRNITGENFTAKDFRTWAGTVHAFLALNESGIADTGIECKKRIVEALDTVAKNLGNTRAVCKKYYVHPCILDMYEKKELQKYFNLALPAESEDKKGLNPVEKTILKILTNN